MNRIITNSAHYFAAEVKRDILDIKGRHISVDDKLIVFDDRAMYSYEVTAMRHGIMQMKIFHGVKTGKYYKIELMNNKNEKMGIFFGPSEIFTNGYNAEETYDNIINTLWHTVKKRLVNEILEKLKAGGKFKSGNCIVTKDGIHTTVRFFIAKKKLFIPWHKLEREVSYGKLLIYPKNYRLLKCRLNFLHTWNAVVLYSLIEFILKDKKYLEQQ
ncbi:MAG: hypothetical protein EHM58_20175 [Ignavibacteriae bacterium]|nr:MAG: hypothetical protein EHM58_20175 [Ignavibacteriota bacterium]